MSDPLAQGDLAGTVRRRIVCYLGGFDPRGPGHYHRLYQDEAAQQAKLEGVHLAVGRRCADGDAFAYWDLHWEDNGAAAVETRYEFWRWDDIVRAHWLRGNMDFLRSTLNATALYLRTGALWQMLQTAWPVFVALVLPPVFLVALLVGLPLVAWALVAGVGAVAGPPVGVVVAIAGVGAALAFARRVEQRFQMRWLMGSYAFTARHALGQVPALEERLDRFAARLAQHAAREDVDEVLIVGHSSGSIMALSALARAQRKGAHLGGPGSKVTLLTLGHCTPLLSLLPQAQAFREELRTVAAMPRLHWIDFGAPPDGCSFALVDPLVAAGVAGDAGTRPKLLSPRFAALFSPLRYARIKADRFRLHFQYVMASELRGDYDYFAISAGPRTLGDRFARHQSIDDFTQFQLLRRRAKSTRIHQP